jgi:hypothetical protein
MNLRFRIEGVLNRHFRVGSVFGVPVFAHATNAALLLASLPSILPWPAVGFTFLACYWLILLLHESGHVFVARSRRCRVQSVEIHPFHGLTWHDAPWGKRDATLIAWGGVAAQAIVFVPTSFWLWSRWAAAYPDAVLAALVAMGPTNAAIAALNLIPAKGFDGDVAWSLFRRRPRWQPPSTALRGQD